MTRFPDRRYFERIGRAAGYRPEPLETVFRLVHLLESVGEELGDEVSLRGGTALNLGFLDLPRLSVDADLDYVGSSDSTVARRRRPDIVRELTELAQSIGYAVVEERPSYVMAHLRLGYINGGGRPATLKLDLNFLDRVPVLPPSGRRLKHPFGDDLPTSTVQMLQFSELVATKLVALARRRLARDLFDASLIASTTAPDLDIVRSVLVVRGAGYPPPCPTEYSPEAVRQISTSAWKSQVLALARRPCPVDVDWARSAAGRLLSRVLDFKQGHRAFLQAMSVGEIRPELLPLSGVQARVQTNPALHWRLLVGADALEER